MDTNINTEFYDLLNPEKKVDFLNSEISFCRNAMIVKLACNENKDTKIISPEVSNKGIFADDHWELFFHLKEQEYPLFQIIVDWQGRVKFLNVRFEKIYPKHHQVHCKIDSHVCNQPGRSEVILYISLDNPGIVKKTHSPVPWNICYCPADNSGIYSHVKLPKIDFMLIEHYLPLDFSGLKSTEETYDFNNELSLEVEKIMQPEPYISHDVFSYPSVSGTATITEDEFKWNCRYQGDNCGYAGISATLRNAQGDLIENRRILRYCQLEKKQLYLKTENFYLQENDKLQLILSKVPDSLKNGTLILDIYTLDEHRNIMSCKQEVNEEQEISVNVDELETGFYLLRSGIISEGNCHRFNDLMFIKGTGESPETNDGFAAGDFSKTASDLRESIDNLQKGNEFSFSIIRGREYNIDMKGHILSLGCQVDPPARDPQSVIDSINDCQGIAIICHPDSPAFYFSHELLLKLNGYIGIEIANHADNKHGDFCETWDVLLTAGKRIYGFATDDTHSIAGVGNFFIQVYSEFTCPDDILGAIHAGHFYSSNGLKIASYKREDSMIRLETDEEVNAVLIVDNGSVCTESSGTSFNFQIPPTVSYARVMLSNHPGQKAWTQPEYPDAGNKCFNNRELWRRANIHSHTNLSDGQFPPWKLALLYKDSGYNSLAITDHF